MFTLIIHYLFNPLFMKQNLLKTGILAAVFGVSSLTGLTAQTSQGYEDVTNLIVNPSFEDDFNGWTNDGMQTHTTNAPADEGWAKDGTYFAEKWVSQSGSLPPASVTQTVEGLSNGLYKLVVSGHAVLQITENPITTGAFLFAGDQQTAVNVGGTYEIPDIMIEDESLTFGFKLEEPITANWTAFDNFRLYYYGDLSDLNTYLTAKTAEAQAILDDEENPDGPYQAEMQTAIDAAGTVEQSIASLENAIGGLEAAIVSFNEFIASLGLPYEDVTNQIVNPSFEDGLTGWTNNGMVTQNNNSPADEGWAKDGNIYVEKWTQAPNSLPVASVEQTIEGLANGPYKLIISGHAVLQGNPEPATGAFLYAGSQQVPVNVGGTYEIADIIIEDGSLTIGYKLEEPITANWTGIDNFRLYFYGDLSALNNTLTNKIAGVQAVLDDENNPAGYYRTEMQAAIDDAGTVEQSIEALEAAIARLDASIASFNGLIEAYSTLQEVMDIAATFDESNYSGRAEFDLAIAEAQAVYNSTEELTAQDLLEAASTLESAIQLYFLSQETPLDATSLLANPDFDLEQITFTENNGAANGPAVIDGRVYDIPGWNEEPAGTWGRIATSNYGLTFDPIPDVLNGTTPPATDMAGNTEGAALKLSGSWGSPAVLTQEVTLAAGTYELSFEVLNMSAGIPVAENRFGFVPNEGDAVYGTTTTFADVWTTETVAFTLEAETTGKISIGILGVDAGAAGNGKLYVDNVALTYLGVVAELSDDAALSALTVDGVSVEGFDAETLTYNVALPAGTVDVPVVAATANHEAATVVVSTLEALPGSVTATVTAEDGTELVYTVEFTVATSLAQAALNQIQVSPTVGNSSFKVLTPLAEGSVSVYATTGQLVLQQEINATSTEIQLSNSGVFLFRIENGNNTKTIKVVKTR